jgi:hypothetical protein
MDDANKKQFWLMINVAMELTNHPPLTKEAIITWWHMLAKYEYDAVQHAVDTWVQTMSKAPTPHDIVELCKPKVTIYAKLPSPLAIADNKRHVSEVKDAIKKMTKPVKDYRAWAHKIIDNPSRLPDISFKIAKEALAAKYHN